MPEAQAIMDKYKGEDEYLLNFIHMYKDYNGFKRGINYALKKITNSSGEVIDPNLSTYYARHSWATIAGHLEVPIETISAGLGHKFGNESSIIYINFDLAKVDATNRMVIDLVTKRVDARK